MKKFLIYCLMALPIALIAACGSSDDPEDSDYSEQAWLCSLTQDGTDVDLLITFDSNNSGVYRMVVGNKMSRSAIYYERTGKTYDCRINNSSSTNFIFSIEGSSATAYDGISYYTFRTVDLKSFYCDWYNKLGQSVKNNLELYGEGGKLSAMFLATAQQCQKDMADVRVYAQIDGITISQSEWETKSSSEYSNNVSNEWIAKYNAQIEDVKELYYEYKQCTNRFTQSAIKSSYESAQFSLARIRAEAADNGIIITQSEWETKKITS